MTDYFAIGLTHLLLLLGALRLMSRRDLDREEPWAAEATPAAAPATAGVPKVVGLNNGEQYRV